VNTRRFDCAIAAVIAVVCLLTAGCLPYAYPKLSCVPGTELGPEASDVHAFRVDAETDFPFGDSKYALTEITLQADGTLPTQWRVTIERGTVDPSGRLYHLSGGQAHETRVRLYRPGYRLVELKSWDSTDRIVWQPASDWRAQVEALTGLLAPPQATASPATESQVSLDLSPLLQPVAHYVWEHLLPLPPTTPEANRVFHVAVAECERLAKWAPSSEVAARLRKLAQKLVEMSSTAGESDE
jgi:hypothetical protein